MSFTLNSIDKVGFILRQTNIELQKHFSLKIFDRFVLENETIAKEIVEISRTTNHLGVDDGFWLRLLKGFGTRSAPIAHRPTLRRKKRRSAGKRHSTKSSHGLVLKPKGSQDLSSVCFSLSYPSHPKLFKESCYFNPHRRRPLLCLE